MATTNPKDYLTLVNTADTGFTTSNYISVPGGGACTMSCLTQTLTRYWTKVHINPSTLVVDQSDHTFSFFADTSVLGCWGEQGGACGGYPNTPYGVANACTNGSPLGAADVDLRGTQFSINPSVTTSTGGSPLIGGSSTFNPVRTQLDETGSGNCGWTQPNILKLAACTNNLTNVGTGAFHVAFAIQTTQTSGSFAAVSQRTGCTAGNFWDVRIQGGVVVVETDQLTDASPNDTVLSGCTAVNDGKPHTVSILRTNGILSVYVDGTLDVIGTSNASFSALPALAVETDSCVGVDGTVPFDTTKGTLTSVCVGPGAGAPASLGNSACN